MVNILQVEKSISGEFSGRELANTVQDQNAVEAGIFSTSKGVRLIPHDLPKSSARA